jgi:acetyl esterase
MTLHPQAQGVLDTLAKLGAAPLHTITPAQARIQFKESRQAIVAPTQEVAQAADQSIPGPGGMIPIRLYRPLGSRLHDKLPALVYFHGGGWVLGDLDTHDALCRALSNQARCAVINVDYRLAPEHKFPAAVEDAWVATRYVAEHAAELGVDPKRIAVGGDSAGGNLATVVALTFRDLGHPQLRFQLMIYPATDFAMDTPSHAEFAQGYMLTREKMTYFCNSYLRGAADAGDWRASPLKAQDLSGLPPALVITASHDPLRDEGKAYADRLTAAGVSARYQCYDGMMHGFFAMGGAIDLANRALTDAAAELARAFA